MKKQIQAVVLATLMLAAAGASARAQSGLRSTVEIPFDFVVAGKTLPAGVYTFGALDPSQPIFLAIKDARGRLGRIFFTQRIEAREPGAQTRLRFIRRGGQYFLSQIWIGGDKNGRSVPDDGDSTPNAGLRSEVTK